MLTPQGTSREVPPVSRLEAKYLRLLRRRIDHLSARIAQQPGRPGESYDRHELSALRWAVAELTDYIGETEPLESSGQQAN